MACDLKIVGTSAVQFFDLPSQRPIRLINEELHRIESIRKNSNVVGILILQALSIIILNMPF